jgi:uncharacterized membrane protein
VNEHVRYRRALASGLILGAGLGGFFDGIVFHQILQTHGMLSAVKPKTNITNMDGIFHAFTWLATVTGLGLFFLNIREGGFRISTRAFVGTLLLGWGLFNVIEGVIDHHVLHLHHVVERFGLSPFDYAFLASGVLLVALGLQLVRVGLRSAET